MYIVRWLMGHPIVAGVVGVLSLLLIFGFGTDTDEENVIDQAGLEVTTQSIDEEKDLALQKKDGKGNNYFDEAEAVEAKKETDEIGFQKVELNKVTTDLKTETQSVAVANDITHVAKDVIDGQPSNISKGASTVELKADTTQVELKEAVTNKIITNIPNEAQKGQSSTALIERSETIKSVTVDENPTSSEKEEITEEKLGVVKHDTVEVGLQKEEYSNAKDIEQAQAAPTLKAPLLPVTGIVNEKVATTEKKETATTDLRQLTTEEMLLMAREAYWNNGLDEAAQIYNMLIEIEPHILEHKGELGNVYWRQGYPKKAAELYSLIAIPMVESGNSDRVANMIGFIGLFYPNRAAEIHRRMQSNY